MNKSNTLDFTGQTIFIGLDVHKTSWKATFSTAHTVQNTVLFSKPFVNNLSNYVNRLFPKATYLCAYEAGFSGFWAQEQLESKGIKTLVVHAADIPTTHKEREFKNDKRDSRKISLTLRSGELQSIYIPSKVHQKLRSMVRQRYSIAKCERRVKCQIRSHLNFYGIETPSGIEDRYWSNKYISWLCQLSEQEQDQTLELLIDRLKLLRKLELKALKQLRALSKSGPYKWLMEILLSVPGIGLKTACLLLSEIMDMNRFKRFDELVSYVGLIPRTNSSGEKEKIGKMTKRGNSRIKAALIESSWIAIRRDPYLLMKYEQLRKRMKGQKAIAKIAVILLRKIRTVWLKQEKYQIEKM